MKTPRRPLPQALFAALAISLPVFADESPAHTRLATLDLSEGSKAFGSLEGTSSTGFFFLDGTTKERKRLEPGMSLRFAGKGTPIASGIAPFHVVLGLGQRLSGRLIALNDREIRLLDVAGQAAFTLSRGGAQALIQRPGETQVFQDGFETLDSSRWTVLGEPELVDNPRITGEKSLRIPSGNASLTHHFGEPVGSGRLEMAFHNDGQIAEGHEWFVDLTFRGPSGLETIRAVLGWSESSLAVETPGGPALAVQRLERKPGWHRLMIRFNPELTELAVDGNELAHGKGFGGPLIELRLASRVSANKPVPADLAAHIDDLRLVRFAEPAGRLETDATQDEARLTDGDQLFGAIQSATPESVAMTIDGRPLALPWADASGLYFRRLATPGMLIEGLLVRAEWRCAPDNGPPDLNIIEGALTALSETELILATAYAAEITVKRDRLTALHILGNARRIVIDPMAHHLGDEISTQAQALDPPQPEGGVLERSVDLPAVPFGASVLVLDVVGVAGEAAGLPFSPLVKKGELRTNVKINGEPFDYLNHYITSKNETAQRIRLPIPAPLLRSGKNVIRFEQAGIAGDPSFLDDLGLLGVAIEFALPLPLPSQPPPH